MSTTFLHGVETIELSAGPRPIRGVKSAVVGLVGTAPIWEVDPANQTTNTPVVIRSTQDAAKYFGTARAGYSIPAALRAIFAQGNGIAIVVNVFDPAVHKIAVPIAPFVVQADGTVQLPDEGVSNVVVKDEAQAVTYVADVDYTLDAVHGVITRREGGAIAVGATIEVSYDKADPTLVQAADIIGAVDAGGTRTGSEALRDSAALFGFGPKLLIAPAYSTQASVATQLETLAEQLRAIALIDAPIGTTVAEAIAGRGPAGALNFNTSSERTILCYPYVKVFDVASDAEVLEPYSQHLAGVIAARDVDLGFWWSPSNAEIRGVTGIERALTASLTDPNSDVNTLNAQGITTVFNGFGTGFRTWGNRSAAWPAESGAVTFVSVRRTADMLDEALQQAMLQFMDQPISSATIDALVESANAYIRTLIGRGALIDGKALADPADNPPEEIAAGHLTISYSFMPPTPGERITFKSFIDASLLSAVVAQQGA